MVDVIRGLQLRLVLATRRLTDEAEGQALVEYALIISLIAIVCVAVLTALGHNVSNILSRIEHGI